MIRGASATFAWYDSDWLARYTRALEIVRRVRPEQARAFAEAFRPLHTRTQFRERLIPRVFDESTMAELRRAAGSLRPADLELHEARTFGRFIVHDHPAFAEVHRRAVPLISGLSGEDVEPSYTFLSLYGDRGVCAAHMDSPEAKYTLDLCLAQSDPWPIHFSDVRPWPVPGEAPPPPSSAWRTYALAPGQAVLFSGSAQWHYRDAIPARPGSRPFCDLLFLHFIPRGTRELLGPGNWARLFGMAELEEVADVEGR